MCYRPVTIVLILLLWSAGCGGNDPQQHAGGSTPSTEVAPAAPAPPPPPAPSLPPEQPAAAPTESPEVDEVPQVEAPAPSGEEMVPGEAMPPEVGGELEFMNGVVEGSQQPGAPTEPPTLLARARQSLGAERLDDGIELLQAAAVAEGEAATEVLDTLSWSPALKRPMLVTRWGIALLTGGMPGGIPMGGQPGNQMRGGPSPHQEGHGGFHHGGGQPGAGGAGFQHEPPGEMGPGAAAGGGPVAFWHHAVGAPLVQALEARVAEGAFGHWLSNDLQRPAADAPAGPPPFQGQEHFEEMAPGHVPEHVPANSGPPVRGMLATHVATLDDAKRWAEEQELDVLLTISVALHTGSLRGPPQTNLVVKVHDVARNQELWSSRPLNSRRVEAALAGARAGENPAQEFLEDLLKFVDENLHLAEMPELDPAVVARRAQALAARKHANPLPALVELRYYASKGLLDETALREHYKAILGPRDAAELTEGDLEQRRQVVEALLR